LIALIMIEVSRLTDRYKCRYFTQGAV
jgi:hypothetical protein